MSKKKSSSNSSSGYVVVQVKVPKAIAEFFRAFSGFSIEAFCEKELIVAAEKILGGLSNVEGYCVDVSEIVERYGLEGLLDWKEA